MTFKLSDSEDLQTRLLAYGAMGHAITTAEESILLDFGDCEAVRDGMRDAIEDYRE